MPNEQSEIVVERDRDADDVTNLAVWLETYHECPDSEPLSCIWPDDDLLTFGALRRVHARLSALSRASAPSTGEEDAARLLRNVVSHATGGAVSDCTGMSLNDMSVEISRHHNRIWKQAQEAPTPVAQANGDREGRARELLIEQGVFDNGDTEWVHVRDATRAILAALTVTPALGREGYVWLPLVDGELPPLPDGEIYGWRTTSGAIYWGEGYPVPVRKFALDRSSCGAILALYVPQPTQGADKALEWLATRQDLQLFHYAPFYGDDEDQSREWRVDKVTGSINDREWETVGRGDTPIAAIQSARAALSHAKDAG